MVEVSEELKTAYMETAKALKGPERRMMTSVEINSNMQPIQDIVEHLASGIEQTYPRLAVPRYGKKWASNCSPVTLVGIVLMVVSSLRDWVQYNYDALFSFCKSINHFERKG